MRASEKHLLELMPAAVYACDRDGRITYFNQQAALIWGRRPKLNDAEERFDGSVKSFMPDGTRLPHEETPMAAALKSGTRERNAPALIERPDGSRIKVRSNVDPIWDDHGAVVGAISVFTGVDDPASDERATAEPGNGSAGELSDIRGHGLSDDRDDGATAHGLMRHDITERKVAEETLRRRVEELETLMAIVPAAIWVSHDPQCLHIVGNRKASELYEATEGENVSAERSAERRFFRDGVELSAEELPMQVAAASGRDVEEELDVLLPSGRSISIWGVARPLRNAEGQVRGAIGAFMETTAHKRAEEALRDSEAKFRTLADNISQLAWMADEKGWIFWYNRRWYEYTGTTLDEMQGWGWQKVHHPEFVDRVVEKISRCFESGEDWEDTFPLRSADGEYRWFLSRAIPVHDDQGNVLRWFGTNTDVTEQRATEEALRVSRALAERNARAAEAANVAKSQFLANMSHELRTPMNAILGMTELALREELSPALADYLHIVKDSGESLLNLLNTLLDFSRIEAGQMELDARPFQLRETVTQVAKTLAVRAAEKELELFCVIEDDVPDGVVGDSPRLRQVLMNLVGNAVKFTDAGEVMISAGVDSRSDHDVRLRFAVSDTGPGIDPEDRERIFSPFAQADASTTRRYGGSGLGLSIVRNVVELMDGEVHLQSEVGRGSAFTFTVRLGVQGQPEAVPSVDPLEREALVGLPVLIVADNATSREMLERTMSGWQMEPTVAENVPAALAKVHQAATHGRPFRLILADAELPEIDGFSLAEWVGKTHSLAGPVILMLSAGERSIQSERCRKVGAASVEKPISQSHLFDTIVQCLGVEHRPRRQDPCPRTPRPSPPLRILLAEDTPANQKLATYLLTGRGHAVEVAENGKQAVERLQREPFDVVLMDVQMPVMDGLQATKAIRELPDVSKAGVPIIAITAHALRRDAERCIAAGMDGYISKPIDAGRLFELVEQAAYRKERSETPAAACISGGSDVSVPGEASRHRDRELVGGGERCVFDRAEAVRRCYGSEEMFEKMATCFLEEIDSSLTELSAALGSQDVETLSRVAHRLKTNVVYLGAGPASAAVEQLEALPRSGNLASAPSVLERLTIELRRLERALTAERKQRS